MGTDPGSSRNSKRWCQRVVPARRTGLTVPDAPGMERKVETRAEPCEQKMESLRKGLMFV